MSPRRVPAALAAALVVVPPVVAWGAPDERTAVLRAMEQELERNRKKLRLEEYDAPYYIGYRVIDQRSAEVTARFGALVQDDTERARSAVVDVRVGDYAFDSSPEPGDVGYFDEPGDFTPSARMPIDDDPGVLRATLWLLTDDAYKRALAAFLRKRAEKVTKVEDKHVDSFSREKPVRFIDERRAFEARPETWAALARRLSARLRADHLLDGTVKIGAEQHRVYLVNTEGTRMVRDQVLYSLSLHAVARADDGMLLEQGRTWYGRAWRDLPDEAALQKEIDTLLGNLRALAVAPVADPYAGPAILEPEATGVFFHEAVGHRLEGERQKDENEGRTFKGQLGKQVLPRFLTVRDDPSLARFEGTPLNGYYPYDDEGVKSRNVILIQDGILKTFLTSRTPVEGVPRSNGHGRAQGVQRPMARMGNLIIESDRSVSRAELKERLLAEVRKQKKPYGLIIRDITGGSTNTSTYGFQAFKGVPRMVYRVDAETGEEQLVRGVEMVGTPLSAVSKIIATSDEVGVFNGYCGAESGYVPVSTVAPATLFREIELQRTLRDRQRKPVLPPPWAAVESEKAAR